MQTKLLNVHNLPKQVERDELTGSTVVVIDLLRATTTITQALASGAREVLPFLEVEDAIAAWTKADREEIVLGGERSGLRIDGFDLGNSPRDYTPQAVAGRCVFITTTNGTRALDHARLARRVVVGAVVNLSAVVASVKEEPRVDILCAGTDGRETGEDIVTAGAIVDQLCRLPTADWQLNHAAAMAGRDWRLIVAKAQSTGCSLDERLAIDLRDTPGGRNLLDIGLEQDLVDCAQIDRFDVVPELDVREWKIRLT
jgi:2-phosphosulfolactate phosphatase